MTGRILTVWCPQWPVVAAGRNHEPAVVVSANRVVARSGAAAEAGIAIGSRRREAQRRCPEVTIVDHDPDRDARAFEPVVRAIAAFSPRLEVVVPGMLCLDAKGPTRYFGGERALAGRLVEAIDEAVAGAGVGGSGVAVGIADGRFASAVAAHRARPGEPVIVEAGASPSFLAPLPVRWLTVAAGSGPGGRASGAGDLGDLGELVELLARLGLTCLGDVAAMSPRDLLARFGGPGAFAHRLAAGADERPADCTDPPPEWEVTETFEQPVESVQPVVFTAKTLADRLAATLAANGQVCTRLAVIAETDHGERSERCWYLAAGLSAPAMVERVRWQLDGWASQPGGLSAGIVLLRLVPGEIRADGGEQAGLWGGRSAADERARHAIGRLAGMVGEAGVCVPVWTGGRLPAERYRWVPATIADLDRPGDRRHDTGDGPWPGSLPTPSPSVVLREPRRLDVTDAEGRPVTVSGRGVASAAPATVAGRPVAAWAGPWPVEQRWWEPDRHRRLARFQIVLDDGTAQVLAVEHQHWWLVATYR